MVRNLGRVITLTIFILFTFCSQPDEGYRVSDADMETILSTLPKSATGVNVSKGNLDGDDLDEFVVVYDDSLKGTVLSILDGSYLRKFEVGLTIDHATKGRLLDMDSDGILEVIVSGPSRGGKSLQIVRSQAESFALVGDFWGLRVKLLDEDDDGIMEVEVENRDFDRDPNRHTVNTLYRWNGTGFSIFRSYKASKRIIF
ncbi:MAG: hypothetical protein ACE5OP_07275 [Candidatus Glassbacteria bacterium]